MSALSVLSNASPKSLAAASVGMGALATYLWMRSKTDTPYEDFKDVAMFIRWKREVDAKFKSNWSLADTIEETAQKQNKKTCLVYTNDGSAYTWSQVNEKANQVAHWAIEQGFKQGDVVALLMDNRPEFIFFWMGLAKIGVCCALINTYLDGKPLIHSLSVCGATTAIIGIEHCDKINKIRSNLSVQFNFFSAGGNASNMNTIDSSLQNQPTNNPSRALRNKTNSNSNLFFIYTSGTTGHPKASVIKHLRFYIAAMVFSELYKFQANDRVYCCLPLYHSAGGMVGIGIAIHSGCTFVFRKKFSASKFWKDVSENRCTAIQYIGELCRYLLAHPPSKYDTEHNLRIAVGNGMRPDVWLPFQERFKIEQIAEFYGATEGNCNIANHRGKYAAVGYLSPMFAPLLPIQLVKFDVEKEEPVRNKDGFCVLCKPNEVGELLGYIDPKDPLRTFDGYTDKKATSKKVLRDVFKKGDAWFRSGDLLRQDNAGYFYFVDRIGDTFRWKGENVSTGEVADVISGIPGVLEANVYGAAIPGHDGRAGMVCMVVNDKEFNFDNFYSVTQNQLPSYAIPLFVRIQPRIEITSTFKHKKADLKKQGFDPSKTTDKLYFRDSEQGKYVPLDEALFNEITSGKRARL